MSIPLPTPDSDEFWAACLRGALTIQECGACRDYNWFPRVMCRTCSSRDLIWKRMCGDAIVYSFSIVARPPAPGLPSRYVVALVDLAEGVRMLTHIVDCPPDEVCIGMPVTVMFRQISEEIALPVFRPSGAANGAGIIDR